MSHSDLAGGFASSSRWRSARRCCPSPTWQCCGARRATRHPVTRRVPPWWWKLPDSSLHLDRGLKAQGYARAGIADYWIVNLLDGVVEVYRDPAPERARRFSYREVRIARLGEVLAPLAKPAARILVGDFLP